MSTDSLLMTSLTLLLAHLLGDFVLQPSSWVRQKETKGIRSAALLKHVLVHGLLAWLLIAKLLFWPWAVALAVLHGLIDLCKTYAQRNSAQHKRRWFWIDQFLHLCLIILIAICWSGWTDQDLTGAFQYFGQQLVALWNTQHLLLITAIVILTTPGAMAIRTLITGWTPAYNSTLETDSLQNAGKYIGMLERLFVFAFIVTGYPEGLGFLLAAKSIFRFGDLKAAQDRKLTEYVLIGTFLSFGIALLTGLLYLKLSEFT